MDSLRKARDKLRHDSVDLEDGDDGTMEDNMADNTVFNSEAMPSKGKPEERSKRQRIKEKAKTIAHVTAHPRQALQQQATKQLVANERPWLDHQEDADVELLDAHDTLEKAQDHLGQATGAPGVVLAVEDAKDRVQAVESEREESQVAWHMSRYVRRARVVRWPVSMPPTSTYHQYDSMGRSQRFFWVKWIGHLVLYGLQDATLHYIEPTNAVPYELETLTLHVERLLVASQDFQIWWMRVRRVYTWEDPWLTFKWLALFLVQLKTSYVMSTLWVYLLYSVVSNFYGKHSRTWMRESHNRAGNTKERASLLSELIIRHGSDAWVEPLMEELGPWIQLQLGDLADFLEISASYYNWRNVSSTAATCVIYVALILLSVGTSLEYSIKILWMGVAQASFNYLREHALSSVQKRSDLLSDDENDILEGDEDDIFFDSTSTPQIKARPGRVYTTPAVETMIMSFPARWSGQRGRLHIFSSSVRFISEVSGASRLKPSSSHHTVLWERSLEELLEVRKVHSPSSKIPLPLTSKGSGNAALSILWVAPEKMASVMTTEEVSNDLEHCEEELIYGMDKKRRDEAFNAMVGVAGAMGALFMDLQPDPKLQTRMH
ncbi:hypothetical protein LTR08_005304 [Meristemomyces frigidus]|nr:hypothetical protein LTR08_005304 [Meristemomyces frigidus]